MVAEKQALAQSWSVPPFVEDTRNLTPFLAVGILFAPQTRSDGLGFWTWTGQGVVFASETNMTNNAIRQGRDSLFMMNIDSRGSS